MNKKINLIGKLSITYAFLLSLCFLFYALIVLPETGAEIVNAKVGLLGWSATIFAPIAAYFLLDSWKDQTKYNAKLDLLTKMVDELFQLSTNIDLIRNNPDTFIYLLRMHNYSSKSDYEKEILGLKDEFQLPTFSLIKSNLEKIRVLNLQIYIYDEFVSSHVFITANKGFDSFFLLDKHIQGLEACFFNIKHDIYLFSGNKDSDDFKKNLNYAFFISEQFKNYYLRDNEPFVHNELLDLLNESIQSVYEDIKEFRKSLD